MNIRSAALSDIETLVPLFDAYRQFYKLPSDVSGAREFLTARFNSSDSSILLAFDGDRPIGFTQLYPSFSSLRMARVFILYDLFVHPASRREGAGRALIEAARQFAKNQGAAELTLSTAVDNITAQGLYEKAGWKRDNNFYVYGLDIA